MLFFVITVRGHGCIQT